MEKVKLGVVGAGSISALHLAGIVSNPHAVLAAVCDVNEERARQTAAANGCDKIYTDYRLLAADPEIDGIIVCTWNNTHAEISIEALNNGKHVLVEKPLCRTVEEALAVQEAVRNSGRLLQVGFVRRYDSRVDLIRTFADQGEFGEFYYAKASTIRRLGNPGGWFSDVERSGGGPLIDLGVHIIDLSWYLMGRPKPVSVSGNTYKKLGNRSNVQHLSSYKAADYDAARNTVEDLANALIRFENGASLYVDVSFTLHAKEDKTTIALFGDKGGCEIEPELAIITEKYDTILNIVPQTDSKSLDITDAFRREVAHFVSCIQTGSQPISPVQDGVEIMKILCGIYESARTGREVLL